MDSTATPTTPNAEGNASSPASTISVATISSPSTMVSIPRPEDELFKPVQKPLNLDEATATMFQNIAAYLKGELLATNEDYKLLENMNNLVSDKYREMTDAAAGLNTFMQSLQDQYAELQPYLQQIDEVDKNVTELEKTVGLLDDYTKRLEAKFKTIDKASLVRVDPTSSAPPPSNPTHTSSSTTTTE